MPADSPPSGAPAGLRALIEGFLQERFDAKAEKLAPDAPKRDELVAQFQFDTWINDAARRVGQLQVVTHSLKPIHPDAKGTNLYVPPESLSAHPAVGSHVLPADFLGDVVGNAAALDVYKFLKLEYQGKSLLERVLENDAKLAAALSDDADQAQGWMQAFAAITEQRGGETSHTRAKQLYWLVGEDPADNGDYHLLAPLYATSLAHKVFLVINEDRFGEAAKAARKARREGEFSEAGYHDYPSLAVQKLGGTKPQNISQLNSERGGNNYLLASLPPRWASQGIKAPLLTDSVFPRFGRRREVKRLVSDLRRFLESTPSNDYQTRDLRDDLNAALMDELMLFTMQLHGLPPGWSDDDKCRLPAEETYWLDPGRAEADEAFREARESTDWESDIRQRFANWLNHALGRKLPLGDTEHRHWSRELERDETYQRWLERDRRWAESLDHELDDWQGGLGHE
ncbi:type I-F CRISPR-associated protein Csy1 [Halomonas sp. ANAO-440]|uniref:type I-F CRISPR-associated protein Csy1 n=1 Tax=Halomonas sp. ANAO-440 TaxID=2861360 RepID=UPI001CAA4AD7|nr:type I-F CRISPR-associated protein Csy1 [Halomonas sp. ANAO-440]MBZ0330802.1 type I-F CRISPR-associated protein Csy1 [Halomonas sp. ANAO-440]